MGTMFAIDQAKWRKRAQIGHSSGEFWLLEDSIVLRLVGVFDVPMAEAVLGILAEGMEIAPRRPLPAFCDYMELTKADAPARKIVQDFVKAHQSRFDIFHYAVSSKMIALAVQVAGMWHGIPTKTWTSRALVELEFFRRNPSLRKTSE